MHHFISCSRYGIGLVILISLFLVDMPVSASPLPDSTQQKVDIPIKLKSLDLYKKVEQLDTASPEKTSRTLRIANSGAILKRTDLRRQLGGVTVGGDAGDEPAREPDVETDTTDAEDDAPEEPMDVSVQASLVFEAPETMKIGESAVIHLTVGLDLEKLNGKDLRSVEFELLDTADLASEDLVAQLVSSTFTINQIGPEKQRLAYKSPTTWSWDVTPTSDGEHTFHATITAVFDDGDERLLWRESKTVLVEQTFTQKIGTFIEDNWKWLWAAILVPLFPLIPRLWKKRKAEATT